MGVVHLRASHVSSRSNCDRTRNEFVFLTPSIATVTDLNHQPDYAVVIIMGVFIFAGAYWLLSARKWFKGPVRTVEGESESGSTYDEKQLKIEHHPSKSSDE